MCSSVVDPIRKRKKELEDERFSEFAPPSSYKNSATELPKVAKMDNTDQKSDQSRPLGDQGHKSATEIPEEVPNQNVAESGAASGPPPPPPQNYYQYQPPMFPFPPPFMPSPLFGPVPPPPHGPIPNFRPPPNWYPYFYPPPPPPTRSIGPGGGPPPPNRDRGFSSSGSGSNLFPKKTPSSPRSPSPNPPSGVPTATMPRMAPPPPPTRGGPPQNGGISSPPRFNVGGSNRPPPPGRSEFLH